MGRWRRVVGVSLFCAACGGRVLGGEAPSADGGVNSSAGGSSSSAGGNGYGSEPLPSCVPGFLESQAAGRSCDFVVDGRCYGDKSSACGCACPRSSNNASTCISGYPVPNGRVSVFCD
jgi:hypothetical protein